MWEADGADLPGFGASFARRANPGERIGVVDIGSNSVRLVIFEGVTRAPAYFYNEKVLCGLGSGLQETGRLDPEGKRRALNALKRFVTLAVSMHVGTLDAVATAAMRDAEDGPEFKLELEHETGLPIRVASGADEARLAAQGVVLGSPSANGVVADLGGASLEFCPVDHGKIGVGGTTALGPLRLLKSGLEGKALNAHIDDVLNGCEQVHDSVGRKLYLVGGSWRALARVHMRRTGYPLNVLHGYTLTSDEAIEIAEWAAEQSPSTLKQFTDSSSSRLAVTPLSARVLARMGRIIRPSRCFISAFGLREGVLFENLPTPLLALDPLLHACEVIEERRSRFPGFGAELFEWLKPILTDQLEGDQRCAHAACILADAVWRTHPDYRAQSCFELVTRGNLTGVTHEERIFIGVALMYRYKGASGAAKSIDAAGLISKERFAAARAVGRAIRLGAMLAGPTPGAFQGSSLERTDEKIILNIPFDRRSLAGEVTDKRLSAVANALGLEPETKIDIEQGSNYWLDDLKVAPQQGDAPG